MLTEVKLELTLSQKIQEKLTELEYLSKRLNEIQNHLSEVTWLYWRPSMQWAERFENWYSWIELVIENISHRINSIRDTIDNIEYIVGRI